MATGQGTVTFSFGAAPGTNIATATGVTATGMSTSSNLEIYIDGTLSTTAHNAYEHRLLPLGGFAAFPTSKAANSFDAQAATLLRLTGDVTCNFVWSD